MDNFKRSRLLIWLTEILIAVSTIFICTKLGFIFKPVGIFISTIFIPLLIAGFLYYMFNPIVKLFMKIKVSKNKYINRTWATTIVFLLALLLIIYLTASVVPHLVNQVANLVSNFPKFAHQQQEQLTTLTQHGIFKKIDWSPFVSRVQESTTGYIKNNLVGLTNSLGNVISMATSVIIIIITVPVILFYMLKDGERLLPTIEKIFPATSELRREQTADLLKKMNETLSKYIGGQVIECLFVGTFTSLGYFFVGQKYALLLGVFAGICNIIPYVGPYFGIVPALLVAFSSNFSQVVWVIVIVIVVQQIDGNLVYPNVIGKSLKIHPLTIIIILLAAGKISGLLGMILAIPFYAVVKVVIGYCYNIWKIQQETKD